MGDKGSSKCVLCNKEFASRGELQEHFRGHAFDRSLGSKKVPQKPDSTSSVECDICKEKFSSSTLAIQHKFRQHPESTDKYHCSTCGAAFTLRDLLRKHEESHLISEEPKHLPTENPCDVCGAVFDNQSALRYHFSTTHQRVMKLYQPIITAPPSKKVKVNNAGEVQSVYYCHICGTEYIVKFNLQRHLETAHTAEERAAPPKETIRCTACDALFYSWKAYDAHNLGHTPQDLYVTDEQQRLQLVSRVDQDFDARRVLPPADKFLPTYRKKRKYSLPIPVSKKKREDEESLSPPSSPDSSDSESEQPAKILAT